VGTNKLVMTKFMADISLCRGGEVLDCKMANYAANPPIAAFMFLMDLGVEGPISGNIRLVDSGGNQTFWYFGRSSLTGVLEISQVDKEDVYLLRCGLSNTHSDPRYLDSLGTGKKSNKTLGNSWSGGKA
jgi:hypothetical protein